jgi:hypothetical protein
MTRRTALSVLMAAGTAAGAKGKKIEIRGMYSSPKPFWDQGLRLGEYGVNALFVSGGSITAGLMARAESEGARVFAEFPTLNGKGYVEKHPEAWPVNERGEKAPAATWFLGACPTEPVFRAWRMKQLDDLLDRFAVAGVWMDYFHKRPAGSVCRRARRPNGPGGFWRSRMPAGGTGGAAFCAIGRGR